MKLLTFEHNGKETLGVLLNEFVGGLVDVDERSPLNITSNLKAKPGLPPLGWARSISSQP